MNKQVKCNGKDVTALTDAVMVVGSKHRLMLRGHCTLPRKRGGKVDSPRATPRPKQPSINSTSTDQSHRCNVCDIHVNSEAQLQQVCVLINIKQN